MIRCDQEALGAGAAPGGGPHRAAAAVDLNDLGGEVLEHSPGLDPAVLLRIVADNPLGQGPYRTPIGLARPGVAGDGVPERIDPPEHPR